MKILSLSLGLTIAACSPPGLANNGRYIVDYDNVYDAATGEPIVDCDDNKAIALLGRTIDAATLAEAKRLADARVVRVIAPGAMVTMDFRGDRLNIDTDASNKAVRFHCG